MMELLQLLQQAYEKGVADGKEIEQQKILLACENGTPINIEERAYFVRGDLQNLRDIFADLEADVI